MTGTYPKTRNCPVGKCPECGSDMFEEVAEMNNNDPNHEMVWYDKIVACSGCRYMVPWEPPEYEPDES